jgi:endonuclease/exonuclease/phosphatase family metal-dependent hydrolase
MLKKLLKILNWFFLITASFLAIQSVLLFFEIWFTSLQDLAVVIFPVIFFISIVGTIYFWILRKKTQGLFLLATLLLACFKMKNNFPLNKSNARSMKIMTWNVQGMGVVAPYTIDFEKRAKIIALVKSETPDVLMLQEVVATTDSFISNHIDSIANLLGYKNYFYDYRSGEGYDTLHHFGRLLLTNYPIIQKNICERNDSKRYSDRVAFIDVQIKDTKYRFTCAHLESMKTDFRPYMEIPDTLFERVHKVKKTDTKLQRILKAFDEHNRQAKLIERFLDSSTIPVFVCGDFNDVPNSNAYQIISNKLKDAHYEACFGFGRTFSNYLPTLRIDYVFVPQKTKVVKCYTIPNLISDHFPVIAQVEL